MKEKIKKFSRKYLLSLIPTLRIKSICRLTLDRELKKQFKKIQPGIVLDVGSKHSPYKKYIPHTQYMRLDISKEGNPDIVSDIHNVNWQSDYFDSIVAIEILEHLHDPQKAVDEIYRLLKKEGICVLSTRFIHPYHPDPKDYYRFTPDSLGLLFNKFRKVKIYHHGNKIQSLWQILNFGYSGILLNIFNPIFSLINFKKTKVPLGFVVYATK